MNEIKIVRKKGWSLNNNDQVVNGIFKLLIKNDGHCPCKHPERIGHDQCPCCSYLEHDICYCNLYIKDKENEK